LPPDKLTNINYSKTSSDICHIKNKTYLKTSIQNL